MAAVSTRPPRALAVALTLIMLLPAALVLVPMASATHPLPTISLTADKSSYILGETVQLTATVSAGTGGCTGTFAPTITGVKIRQAEPERFGWATFDFSSTTTSGVWVLNMLINATPGGKVPMDPAATVFEATASSRCTAAGIDDAGHTTVQTQAATASVTIDNTPPTGSALFEFTTLDQYRVSMSGVGGATSVVADMRALGLTEFETVPTTASSTTSFTLPATVSATPVKVTIGDATGNTVPATAPSRLGSDLQAYAIPHGNVQVRFTHVGPGTVFEFGIKRPTASTWERVLSTDPIVTATVSGMTHDYILPFTRFDQNASNQMRVWQKDGANDGVPSGILTFTPAPTPNAVAVTGAPSGAMKDIGVLAGTSTSPTADAIVRLALQRADGAWWQNDTAGTFGATLVYASAHRAANGDWTTDLFSLAGSNAANVDAIANGAYSLVVQLVAPDGVVLAAPPAFPIIIDRTPPVTPTGTTKLLSGIADGVHQRGPVLVQLALEDATSSIKNVTFQLRHKSTAVRVAGVGGGLVEAECLAPSCLTTGTYNQPTLNGIAKVVFPSAPVGTYELVVIAYDAAGNQIAPFRLSNDFKVVPAVQLRSPEMRNDALFFDILAEYRTQESMNPSENCTPYGYSCKVSEIRIFGRNGGTGDGQILATLTAPHGAMSLDENSRAWWNYTVDSGIGPGTLSRTQPIQVRAIARAQIAPGTADSSFAIANTSWTNVITPTNPGGIIVRYPTADWKINATGVQKFIVNFNQSDLTTEAFLKGTLKRLDAAAPDVQVGPYWGNVNTGNVRPRVSFNYTFELPATPGTTLADGQYALELRALTNDSEAANTVLARATRYFAVQQTAPVVAISNMTQTGVFARGGDNWVGRQFFLDMYVDPGFANTTSADFGFELQRNVRGTGKTLLNNSEEEFLVQVANPQDLNPIDKDAVVRLNVTLPSTGLDGDVFTLRVRASTDIETRPNGQAWTNMTNVTFPLRLDLNAPAAGVDLTETNVTAVNGASELRIIGFATDTGAGVDVVEVRLVNLTSNTTFHWPNTFWNVGSDADQWASTRPFKMKDNSYTRDVGVISNVTTGSTHSLVWSVNETHRPRLDAADVPIGGNHERLSIDRGSRYRVDMRITDRLGRTSTYSQEIGLDPQGPAISALTAEPGPYKWHGHANMSVQVSDNWCVASVGLVARTDAGREYGPIEFDKPSGTLCRQANATILNTYTIDLAKHPVMTDEITNYTYWVRAMDASGNVTETPVGSRTVKRLILDTEPAMVKFLRLEPPLVTPGARSRVVAEIFEVGGIDRVRVFLHRINSDRTYTQQAEGVMRPLEVSANGSGEYVAETDTDLGLTNLTLGDYLWEVRPMDKSWETTCAVNGLIQCRQENIILRVVSDAGIFIQPELPAASASFINGTPVFRWKVFDKTITASGISILAGNSSDNLAPVTPTSVTELPPSGDTRTGLQVEYRPTVTGDAYAIRLRATSEGVTNETTVRTFAVDAVPPVVNHTILGAVDVGDLRYAISTTRVNVTATDATPLVITYTVNGGAVETYTGNVTPSGADGEWRFDYVATDAGGNVARGTLTLALDRTEPSITVAKHGDEVLLTVTDAGVGVNESTVRVHFAYGDETSFTPATLEKVTGNSYRAQLTGNSTATGLRYYFEARDALGNTGTRYSAGAPYVIEPEGPPANLPPTLQLTSPAANSAARQKVELRWLAEDPEGQELTITIALRSPTGQGRILQTAGPNNGTYVVDLTDAPAGTHTLVVTASDGEQTAQESVNFLLERGEVTELVRPPPVQVTAGDVVPFAVRVNGEKPVANVTYTLLRGTESVESGEMKANQGSYSVNLEPKEAGRYGILVTVAYADGTSEPQREVASFTVSGAIAPPPSAAFPASLITLVVLALMTVALAAYAAFVRWGR